MPSHRPLNPLIVMTLGSVLAVLALIVTLVVPPHLSFLALPTAVVLVLSLVVVALAVAHHAAERRGIGREAGALRSTQRWASLIAGGMAAAATLAITPAVHDLFAPLDPPVPTIAVAGMVSAALLMAGMGVWGFTRR